VGYRSIDVDQGDEIPHPDHGTWLRAAQVPGGFEDGAEGNPRMYKRILIATDGSALAKKAETQGLALAKEVKAEVIAVTITEPWSALDMSAQAGRGATHPVEDYEKHAAAVAEKILSSVSAIAKENLVASETLHVKDQHPADGIRLRGARERRGRRDADRDGASERRNRTAHARSIGARDVEAVQAGELIQTRKARGKCLSMARKSMPTKACVRCGKLAPHRRSGRPTCRYCGVILNELQADNEMRRMGKLKGTRGRC
jgi:nucleotide-binding universal stress UspA family protein